MSKRTVLLAENDGIISLDLKSLLKSNNSKPVLAKSAENLVVLYKSFQPDLVIADLSPGKNSNEEALKEIRRIDSTPIILLSGSSKNVLERLAKSLSPCTYLSKPFDKAELLVIIEKYIGK